MYSSTNEVASGDLPATFADLPVEVLLIIISKLQTSPNDIFTGTGASARQQVSNGLSESERQNFRDAIALYNTSRTIRNIIGPIFYAKWACHPHPKCIANTANLTVYEEARLRRTQSLISHHVGVQPQHFLPRLSDVPNLKFNSLLTSSNFLRSPYFCAGHLDVPDYILNHVGHLGLSFNEISSKYGPWFLRSRSKMIALKEVTLNLDSPLNLGSGTIDTVYHYVGDLASIIDFLEKDPEELIVHTYIRLVFKKKASLLAYLKQFANNWLKWQKLRVHTLSIEVGKFNHGLPIEFRSVVRNLAFLKSFSAYLTHAPPLHLSRPPQVSQGFCTCLIPEWVNHLNLEVFTMNIPCLLHAGPDGADAKPIQTLAKLRQTQMDLAITSSLKRASWTFSNTGVLQWIARQESLTFFEVFKPLDHVSFTNLPLSGFLNLETLVFTQCKWSQTHILLEHFVGYSPRLTHLITRNLSGEVIENNVGVLLAKFTHIEVYQGDSGPNLSAEMVLGNAGQLENFIYDFVWSFLIGDVSLTWLLDMVIARHFSNLNTQTGEPYTPLRQICFSIPSHEADQMLEDWESNMETRYEDHVVSGIKNSMPEVVHENTQVRSFILQVQQTLASFT